MEYGPTRKEIQDCKKMLEEEFMLYDEERNQKYTDRIMTISYAIGGDYNINTLRKIASVILKNDSQ